MSGLVGTKMSSVKRTLISLSAQQKELELHNRWCCYRLSADFPRLPIVVLERAFKIHRGRLKTAYNAVLSEYRRAEHEEVLHGIPITFDIGGMALTLLESPRIPPTPPETQSPGYEKEWAALCLERARRADDHVVGDRSKPEQGRNRCQIHSCEIIGECPVGHSFCSGCLQNYIKQLAAEDPHTNLTSITHPDSSEHSPELLPFNDLKRFISPDILSKCRRRRDAVAKAHLEGWTYCPFCHEVYKENSNGLRVVRCPNESCKKELKHSGRCTPVKEKTPVREVEKEKTPNVRDKQSARCVEVDKIPVREVVVEKTFDVRDEFSGRCTEVEKAQVREVVVEKTSEVRDKYSGRCTAVEKPQVKEGPCIEVEKTQVREVVEEKTPNVRDKRCTGVENPLLEVVLEKSPNLRDGSSDTEMTEGHDSWDKDMTPEQQERNSEVSAGCNLRCDDSKRDAELHSSVVIGGRNWRNMSRPGVDQHCSPETSKGHNLGRTPDSSKSQIDLSSEVNLTRRPDSPIDSNSEVTPGRESLDQKAAGRVLKTLRVTNCKCCSAKVVKFGGCNKLTCFCGRSMCYVCGVTLPIQSEWEHFCEHERYHTRDPCTSCKLCDLYEPAPEEKRVPTPEEVKKKRVPSAKKKKLATPTTKEAELKKRSSTFRL